jgi:hypothetical protein
MSVRVTLREALVSMALLAAGGGCVAFVQPHLAATTHAVKQRDDVYVLPPPAELRVATLGYDAAAVDLLWAKLLVEYGTHWSERRDFFDIPKYVDAIIALEPDYAPIYRYVDTMLAFRPLQGTEDDVRLARGYLERGTRERPEDWHVWMEYGQFLAFIAPSFLTDQAERDRWRRDGAEAMTRAVDFGGDADRALSAATILSKSGELAVAIRSLRRAYALASDVQTQEEIAARLASLEGMQRDAAEQKDARFIDKRWSREAPYLDRSEYLLLGPAPDPLRCAGLSGTCADPACCRTWSPLMPSSQAAPLE